mmetsp:Transcript_40868/g.118350  ORF Transcript_40868/g.118350 Transcript_40868/m.118350 type:complete len:156 (-) Transcript_40868:257-724(-)
MPWLRFGGLLPQWLRRRRRLASVAPAVDSDGFSALVPASSDPLVGGEAPRREPKALLQAATGTTLSELEAHDRPMITSAQEVGDAADDGEISLLSDDSEIGMCFIRGPGHCDSLAYSTGAETLYDDCSDNTPLGGLFCGSERIGRHTCAYFPPAF